MGRHATAIWKHILPLIVGLTVANYIWQAMTFGNWSEAFERSFFQALALGLLWLNQCLEEA